VACGPTSRPHRGVYTETPIDPGTTSRHPRLVIFQYVLRWAKTTDDVGIEGQTLYREISHGLEVLDTRRSSCLLSHSSPRPMPSFGLACLGETATSLTSPFWNRPIGVRDMTKRVAVRGLESIRMHAWCSTLRGQAQPLSSEAVCESSRSRKLRPNARGLRLAAVVMSEPAMEIPTSPAIRVTRRAGAGCSMRSTPAMNRTCSVRDGQILGLDVPTETLENDVENPPRCCVGHGARYKVEVHTPVRSLLAASAGSIWPSSGRTARQPSKSIRAPTTASHIYSGKFLNGSTDTLFGVERDLES